jgi:hypothetical protein
MVAIIRAWREGGEGAMMLPRKGRRRRRRQRRFGFACVGCGDGGGWEGVQSDTVWYQVW